MHSIEGNLRQAIRSLMGRQCDAVHDRASRCGQNDITVTPGAGNMPQPAE